MKKSYTIIDHDGNPKKVKVSGDDASLSKKSPLTKVFFIIVFVIFTLYSITLIIPFVFLLLNAMKGRLEYVNGLNTGNILALPEKWLVSNFIDAFSEMKMVNSLGEYIYLPQMLINSIWMSITSVVCGIMASAIVAYSLAKYKFKLHGFIWGICIFNMTIPIIGSTGSAFKLYIDIGIYNTPLFVFLTSFGGFGFNMLILYGFFKNISWSYAEAVFIDGGGHATVFFKIMLPQALPPMMTLAIMSFIGCWNDYMSPLLYMPDYPTLASGIYKIQTTMKRDGHYPLYFAGLVIATVPVVAIYAIFSDMIMKNFTVGGLKG